MRVLSDFHHSSLLRATNMLFGDRLGAEVFRPIGMEWYEEGFWAINDLKDTAKQFLEPESQPIDKTPVLNHMMHGMDGIYHVYDPGQDGTHMACTLDFFKQQHFDILIASIPAHIPLFERLIAEYQPDAKLIVQIGNEWPEHIFAGHNVLASVKPRLYAEGTNAIFYHQEFDLDIFQSTPVLPTRQIYSFINVLESMPLGSLDFQKLEHFLEPKGYTFKSYGGQCRDGNATGPEELAASMKEAQMIFHVKDGGDGFGHILYNAYACGRPVITRKSFYEDRLGEELLIPGTFIDLDQYSTPEAVNVIQRITYMEDILLGMGERAAKRFREVVDYRKEAEEIRKWLNTLQ